MSDELHASSSEADGGAGDFADAMLEQAQLLAHLLVCVRCRQYLRLSLVEPPADLRARLVEAARRMRQPPPL
jgi:hypothetical protein